MAESGTPFDGVEGADVDGADDVEEGNLDDLDPEKFHKMPPAEQLKVFKALELESMQALEDIIVGPYAILGYALDNKAILIEAEKRSKKLARSAFKVMMHSESLEKIAADPRKLWSILLITQSMGALTAGLRAEPVPFRKKKGEKETATTTNGKNHDVVDVPVDRPGVAR